MSLLQSLNDDGGQPSSAHSLHNSLCTGYVVGFKSFGAGPFWHQREGSALVSSVHPLAAIPSSTVARDFVLIVLKVKLVVVSQLERQRKKIKNKKYR